MGRGGTTIYNGFIGPNAPSEIPYPCNGDTTSDCTGGTTSYFSTGTFYDCEGELMCTCSNAADYTKESVTYPTDTEVCLP
jgi:hypothetical protein